MQWLLRMMFQSGAGGICPEFPEYVAKQGLQARATYEKLAQQVAAMEAAAAGAMPGAGAVAGDGAGGGGGAQRGAALQVSPEMPLGYAMASRWLIEESSPQAAAASGFAAEQRSGAPSDAMQTEGAAAGASGAGMAVADAAAATSTSSSGDSGSGVSVEMDTTSSDSEDEKGGAEGEEAMSAGDTQPAEASQPGLGAAAQPHARQASPAPASAEVARPSLSGAHASSASRTERNPSPLTRLKKVLMWIQDPTHTP